MKPHVLKQMCQFCLIALCLVSLPSCAKRKEATSLTAVRHFDDKQAIESFSVDQAWGGVINQGEGSSGKLCCVIIPEYRENLKVSVYWELHSPKEDEVRTYVADVPVEPYDINNTSGLTVHFYDNEKVRVIVDGVGDAHKQRQPSDDNNPLGNFPFPPEQLAQGRLVKVEKHVSEARPDIDYFHDDDPKSKDRIRTRRDCCWVTPEDKAKYAPKPTDAQRSGTP